MLLLMELTYGISVTTDHGRSVYVVLLAQLLALRLVLRVSHAHRRLRRLADVALLVVAVALVSGLVIEPQPQAST